MYDFNIYNYGLENIDSEIKNKSIDIEIVEEDGLNNIVYFVNKNNEKTPISEFNHDLIDMKVLFIKENNFGKIEMFLSFSDEELDNEKVNTVYNAIRGFEETLKNIVKLKNTCNFNSNIIDEYTYTNRNGEEVVIPKRFKLNIQKFLEENNKTISDYPKNTKIKCNITCNKLWINPNINKYGIWWSVNNIQIDENGI